MAKTSNHFILILCGGSGPRLWPLSRASKPKQFLKIFSTQTLLQETINRFKKVVPTTHIYLITQQKYLSEVKKEVSKLIPTQNIITEPEKKNTALAIAYGSSIIHQIDSHAIITTTPADHFINNIPQFAKDVSTAIYIAEHQSKIVALGTRATSPNPAYGYIVPITNSFIEKPNESTALKLLMQKAYWNIGIYTFTYQTLVSELEKWQPKYFSLITQKDIKKMYSQSPSLSFDVAISEKTKNLALVPAKFTWSDVGQWKSIFQKLPKLENDFSVINQTTNYIQYNSQRCLVSGPPKKLIGIVGVSNLAIIDTPDGLLICNLATEDSYHVRDLVTQMVSNSKNKKFFLSANDK